MSDRKRIIIFVPEGCFHGRKILNGLRSYIRSVRQKEWLPNYPMMYAKLAMRCIKSGHYDGIITSVNNENAINLLDSFCLPCVTIGMKRKFSKHFNVHVDNEAVGKMGAQYFLDRGFKRYIYIGLSGSSHANKRFEGFKQTIQNASKDYPLKHIKVLRKNYPAGIRLDGILDWINSSSQPVGLMAYNDTYALMVLNLLAESNNSVPDKVAVLGVDNNPNICELSDPEISSVKIGFEMVGYKAASLLDEILSGGNPPREPILIPPIGVVTRQSTNIFAVDDETVAQAGQYISEHACNMIQVRDVAEKVSIGRRALEKRFAKVLGRSPHSEIRRVQIEKACNLLAESHQNIPEVAIACGFGSERQFYDAFKNNISMSPGEFRSKYGIKSDLWQSE